MLINVEAFKTLLRKATLNYAIDNVSLVFTGNRIKSQMNTKSKDAMSILNVKNDVVSDVKAEMVFNFFEPNTQLLPYLNLIDGEEAILDFSQNKIKITNGSLTSTIHFCHENSLSIFGAEEPKFKNYFHTLKIDENVKEAFNKIKKIAVRFGRVHFSVIDNVLYMEATDKKNPLSNGLTFELTKIQTSDKTLTFDFKNLNHIFNILNPEEEFEMNFGYLEEQKMGILYVKNEVKSEQYILMSIME